MQLDWRGRVYGVPSFNLQREDRVRALFMFADGEPISDEGLKWLQDTRCELRRLRQGQQTAI